MTCHRSNTITMSLQYSIDQSITLCYDNYIGFSPLYFKFYVPDTSDMWACFARRLQCDLPYDVINTTLHSNLDYCILPRQPTRPRTYSLVCMFLSTHTHIQIAKRNYYSNRHSHFCHCSCTSDRHSENSLRYSCSAYPTCIIHIN